MSGKTNVVTVEPQRGDESSEAASLIRVIERAAVNPDVDIDKMERLLAMHERILAKNAESAFNDAMTRVQAEVGRVAADLNNAQTRSKYASYTALDGKLRPHYTAHGFSISFDTGQESPEGFVRVLAYVSHSAGHTRTYNALVPADGKGAKGGDVMTKTHAFGAGTSYGMRYLLKMIFNIAIGEDDNDGNDPDPETVSQEQAANITALLTEVGGDKVKFLQYFRVGSIDAIPAASYARAIAALEKKRGAA